MKVELLQYKHHPGWTTKQLLPGEYQKDVTVGSDLKASVTYTRDQASLQGVGDYVMVVFNGATDYARQRVDMTRHDGIKAYRVRQEVRLHAAEIAISM